MTKIQLPPDTHHLLYAPTMQAVRLARTYGGVVKPEVAATIAAWWQAPSHTGRHLATLTSGLPVELEDLLDDVDATVGELDPLAFDDRATLEALRSWALSRPSDAMTGWENRVVTVTLLESEWCTAVDALRDRASQVQELAEEVDDAELVASSEDYERVAREIEGQLSP